MMIEELKQYLEKLPPRDRLALIALTAFLAVFLVGLGLWKLHASANKAETAAQGDRETLSWMQSLGPQLQSGRLGDSSLSVLDAISGAAAAQGITLQRFEPDGERVRVWLEAAEFPRVATWMDALERQGVKAQEVHFEQTDKGLSVRLVFGR